MTDDTRMRPAPESCGFEAQRSAYLDGTLDDAACEDFEAHLAACARCEALVEPVTRLDLSPHRAAPPASARAAVLEQLAPRATTASGVFRNRSRWFAGTALVAAALAVVIMRQANDRANDRAVPTGPGVPTPAETLATVPGYPELGPPRNAMLGTAAQLARDPSLAEFRALDAAAQELEAALRETPADPDVRAQLDALRARRAELADKVKEAAS